jgi:hypothetical protein
LIVCWVRVVFSLPVGGVEITTLIHKCKINTMNTITTTQMNETFSLPFFEKYFASLQKGKYIPYSAKEISTIVNTHYFSGEALIPLTNHEETILRAQARNILMRQFKKSFLHSLITNDFIFLNPKQVNQLGNGHGALDKNLLVNITETTIDCCPDIHSFIKKKKIPLMTNREKVNFVKDINIFQQTRYRKGNCESPCSHQGYRPLEGYGYDSESLFKQVQISTGKKNITVLDLGGGIGLAAHDMKLSHPEISTINITCDTEPVMFTADRTTLCFAERFPKDLCESVDLVITNMAFRYFFFPDLAVKNVVTSLSVGGIADIFVTSERSSTPDDELEKRLSDTYFWLTDLAQKGIIEIEFSFGSVLGTPIKVEETLYPCRGLYIKKLKSMKL